MALFGGFNFISREIVVDYDDVVSYYDIVREIVKGYDLTDVKVENCKDVDSFYDVDKDLMGDKYRDVKDKAERKALFKRDAIVRMYLNDIRRFLNNENGKEHWVIFFIGTAKKSDVSKADAWLISAGEKKSTKKAAGEADTVETVSGVNECCLKDYDSFFKEVQEIMKTYELDFQDGNSRHKLVCDKGKINAGLLLRENGATFDCFDYDFDDDRFPGNFKSKALLWSATERKHNID